MPLYEPLRETFRDMRRMWSDMNTVAMNEERTRMQLQHQMAIDQFNMSAQKEEMGRQAQARKMFADFASNLLARNPIQDRQNQLAQLEQEYISTGQQLKDVESDPAFRNVTRKYSLGMKQYRQGLVTQRDKIKSELEDPQFMVNQYTGISADAQKAAIMIGQYDPNLSNILLKHADNAQSQANTYVNLLNSMKTSSKAPKTNTIPAYAKPGHPDFPPGALVTAYEVESGQQVPLKEFETTMKPDTDKGTESSRSVTYYSKDGKELDTYNISNKPGPLNKYRIEQAKKYGLKVEDVVTTAPKEKGATMDTVEMVKQFAQDVKIGGMFGDITEAAAATVRDAMMAGARNLAKEAGLGPNDDRYQIYGVVKEHFALANDEYFKYLDMKDNWETVKVDGKTFKQFLKEKYPDKNDRELQAIAKQNAEELYHKRISELTGGKHAKFLPSKTKRTLEQIGQY